MTTPTYQVSWSFREGDTTVRRGLRMDHVAPCVEAARILDGNPYVSEIEVYDLVGDRTVEWAGDGSGRILYREPPEITPKLGS
jgi:hypothetical protein